MSEKSNTPPNADLQDGVKTPAIDFKRTLELLARVSAALFVLTYGTGFLIVSLHNSAYGVSQFEILKPRVFGAGILFFFLLAVPLVAASKIFSVVPSGAEKNAAKWWFWESRRWLGYCITCVALTLMARFILEASFERSPAEISFLIALAFMVTVFLVTPAHEEKRPAASGWLAVLASSFLAVSAFFLHDQGFQLLLLWFFVVGVLATKLRSKVLDPKQWSNVDWERWAINLIFFVSLFSSFLFDKIKAEFGGGSPISVHVTFDPAPPTKELGSERLFLLDENEHGYFLLLKRDGKDAIFVPRGLIRAVHFFGDKSTTVLPAEKK